MEIVSLIIIICKTLGQAMTFIAGAWDSYKIYSANATFKNAGEAMDRAIADQVTAAHQRNMKAQAEALARLAQGGN